MPPTSAPRTSDSESSSWPTLRGDMARTGSARGLRLPASSNADWQIRLGRQTDQSRDRRRQTAGRGDRPAHRPRVGRRLRRACWQYTAGGRVDSPPSIAGNLAVFGCADGYVYCLRLDRGQLVWRFRAAPRSIGGRSHLVKSNRFGRSPGTPLVRERDGLLHRRPILLPGRRHVPVSPGTVDRQTAGRDAVRRSRPEPRACNEKKPSRMSSCPGALPDVLVDDGQYIYLRDKVLDHDGVEQEIHVPHLYCSAGLLDDHWWHRTSWLWGERNWGRASGWAVMPGIRPSGRILVTDDATVFGYGRKSVQGQHAEGISPVPSRQAGQGAGPQDQEQQRGAGRTAEACQGDLSLVARGSACWPAAWP